jgi:hypothetical protein
MGRIRNGENASLFVIFWHEFFSRLFWLQTYLLQARNVLMESARIARGAVEPLSSLAASSAAAVVFPGGFGAAKNLSDFGFKVIPVHSFFS